MIVKKYITKLDENKHNVLHETERVEIPDIEQTKPLGIAAMLNEVFDMQNLAEEHLYMLAYMNILVR